MANPPPSRPTICRDYLLCADNTERFMEVLATQEQTIIGLTR